MNGYLQRDIDRRHVRALRAEIKRAYPDLEFKVRTVSFQDLARADAVFVTLVEWSGDRSMAEIFHGVEEIATRWGAIVQ